MGEYTNIEKVATLLRERNNGNMAHIADRLEPNRRGDPKIGLLTDLTAKETIAVMQAVHIADYGAVCGIQFMRRVMKPDHWDQILAIG